VIFLDMNRPALQTDPSMLALDHVGDAPPSAIPFTAFLSVCSCWYSTAD